MWAPFLLALLGATDAAFIRRAPVNMSAAPLAAAPLDLTAEGREDLRLLLQDLGMFEVARGAELGVAKRRTNEPKEEFVPRCLQHVKQLVKTIDTHYTDAQLEAVLTHDCQLSQEFPKTQKSNFPSHEACLDFAKKLTAARMKELSTGKQDQYEELCSSYYEQDPPVESAAAAPPKPIAAPAKLEQSPPPQPPPPAAKKQKKEKKSSSWWPEGMFGDSSEKSKGYSTAGFAAVPALLAGLACLTAARV